jgi:hypothetical protein
VGSYEWVGAQGKNRRKKFRNRKTCRGRYGTEPRPPSELQTVKSNSRTARQCRITVTTNTLTQLLTQLLRQKSLNGSEFGTLTRKTWTSHTQNREPPKNTPTMTPTPKLCSRSQNEKFRTTPTPTQRCNWTPGNPIEPALCSSTRSSQPLHKLRKTKFKERELETTHLKQPASNKKKKEGGEREGGRPTYSNLVLTPQFQQWRRPRNLESKSRRSRKAWVTPHCQIYTLYQNAFRGGFTATAGEQKPADIWGCKGSSWRQNWEPGLEAGGVTQP